jgi:hypothetical protein
VLDQVAHANPVGVWELVRPYLDARGAEQSSNVRRWIDEQVSYLERSIDQALAEEEREVYAF